MQDDHGDCIRILMLDPYEMNLERVLRARLGIDIMNIRDEVRILVQFGLSFRPIELHPGGLHFLHPFFGRTELVSVFGPVFVSVDRERGETKEGFEIIDFLLRVGDGEGLYGDFGGGKGHRSSVLVYQSVLQL